MRRLPGPGHARSRSLGTFVGLRLGLRRPCGQRARQNPTPTRRSSAAPTTAIACRRLAIDQLPDNVIVRITNGRPIRELDEEIHEYAAELRQQWLAKTSNALSLTLNYTPSPIEAATGRSTGRTWPRAHPGVPRRRVARGCLAFKRQRRSAPSGHGSSESLRYFPVLVGCGPGRRCVAGGILSPVLRTRRRGNGRIHQHCEREFANLGSDTDVTKKALELFDQAKAAAPPDSVYGRRIALVDEFLPTLRNRATQIEVPRPEGLPEYRLIDMAGDKWRDVRDTLKMDGKLDEGFWTAYYYPRPLKDMRTGKKPEQPTRFMARWWNDSLYFGIRCEFDESEPPIIGTRQDNDPAIWQGEHLELLIETDKHSYYQIVINPAGAVIDLDRA